MIKDGDGHAWVCMVQLCFVGDGCGGDGGWFLLLVLMLLLLQASPTELCLQKLADELVKVGNMKATRARLLRRGYNKIILARFFGLGVRGVSGGGGGDDEGGGRGDGGGVEVVGVMLYRVVLYRHGCVPIFSH